MSLSVSVSMILTPSWTSSSLFGSPIGPATAHFGCKSLQSLLHFRVSSTTFSRVMVDATCDAQPIDGYRPWWLGWRLVLETCQRGLAVWKEQEDNPLCL